MKNNRIRIGGVPEHFNLPIHLGIERGAFQKQNIQLEWHTYPGGTGQMNAALRNGECDLCIVLTEGIISDIVKGNPSKIVSGYVKTPLIWGIYTGIENSTRHEKSIFEQKVAISRHGSGSHLMPIVHALDKGVTINDEQFIVIKDIEGAIKSLNSGESQIFYWEKYTTKPYVENHKLQQIGEFISPWPCFLIAATENIIKKEPELTDRLLKTIHSLCDDFMKDGDNVINLVSERFELRKLDAQHWFHSTEWNINSWVSDKMLTSVLFTLEEAGIVPPSFSTHDLVWNRSKS